MTTSSDGYLTATADLASASVLLSTDFSAAVPAPTVNLLVNPNTELGVSLLTATSNCSVLGINDSGVPPGTWVTRQSATGAGNMSARTVENPAVLPGISYTVSAFVRGLSAVARSVRVGIVWLDAAGAQISVINGSSVTDTTGTYATRPSCTATAPATARSLRIEVVVLSAAAGESHGWDGFQVERGPLTLYCDGYQTGCAWSGAPSASMSYRPGYHKVTIRRADGTIVRGSDGATAPNGVHAKGIDHEAPLGTAVVYTASVTNGIATITSTTATATVTGQTQATWLKSLRTPAMSMPIYVERWPDWERAIDLAAMPRLASRYPSVAAGLRQASTGTLTVLTLDAVDRAKLTALIESDGPYLLQGSVAAGEPDRYVAIDTASIERINRLAVETVRRFALPLIEVARPETAGSRVSVPGHTYADSKVTWPLYSNRTGAYGTR